MLFLDAIVLVGVSGYIMIRREQYAEIFTDFGVEPPWVTWLALQIPDWIIIAVVGATMIFLTGKEMLFRWRTFRLTINLFVFACAILLLVAFLEAMLMPLSELLEALG